MITKKKNPHDVHWHFSSTARNWSRQEPPHNKLMVRMDSLTIWPYGTWQEDLKVEIFQKKKSSLLQSDIFNEGLIHQKLSVDIANLRLWYFASWCASLWPPDESVCNNMCLGWHQTRYLLEPVVPLNHAHHSHHHPNILVNWNWISTTTSKFNRSKNPILKRYILKRFFHPSPAKSPCCPTNDWLPAIGWPSCMSW